MKMIISLLCFAIAMCLLAYGCSQSTPTASTKRVESGLADQQQILQKQNDSLKSQIAAINAQNQMLKDAFTAAGLTASDIVKAIFQGATASTQATGTSAVETLGQQHNTLIEAAGHNDETMKQLKSAQDQNLILKGQNGELTSQNEILVDNNKKLNDSVTQLNTQIAAMAKQIQDDNDEKAKAENEKLLTYFGWSIAALIAGIAAMIWVPAPAKTIGYVLASIGAIGLALTIFLLTFMYIFKWVLLAVFVGAVGWIGWQLYKTHGALTKTSEGVAGIKSDLSAIGTPEATKVVTDYFGTADNKVQGIFTMLHSEYRSIMDKVVAGVKKLKL